MSLDPKTDVRALVLKPAAIFDLDGTIRRAPDGGFTGLGRQELFPGVEEVLWAARDEGYLIFGATNQGGVDGEGQPPPRGRDSGRRARRTRRTRAERRWDASCRRPGGTVKPWCYRSLLRKPGVGMLVLLEIKAYDAGYILDWDNSLMVGDRPEDEGCAKAAGIEFAWAWAFFGREAPS